MFHRYACASSLICTLTGTLSSIHDCSRERSRNDREQRKLGMEAKWSAGNRRYQASLLSERREVRQSGIFERVPSESTCTDNNPMPTAPITTTMVHDDEPDWAKDI